MIGNEELFIRTLSTTLLQILCKFMLHSKVIFENLKGPDDSYQVVLLNELRGQLLVVGNETGCDSWKTHYFLPQYYHKLLFIS